MRTRFQKLIGLVMALTVLTTLLSPVPVSADSKPYSLTIIDPPGSILTQQFGSNARGDIVGYYLDSAQRLHGYLYSRGEFTILDVPSDIAVNVHTLAVSINSGGDIVGYYRTVGDPAQNLHGFLRTSQGVWSKVDAPGHLYTMPNSILSDGTILGCVHETGGADMHGVILKDGVWSEYPSLPTITMHNAATPDGKMIVGQTRNGTMPPGTYHGYLLDNGNFIQFAVPSSTNTVPLGINPAGVIVGVYNDATGAHGFMVQPQGRPVAEWQFTTINVSTPGRTVLRAINAGGDLVGTYTTNQTALPNTPNTWHGFQLSRTGR